MNSLKTLFTFFLILPLTSFSQENKNTEYKILKDSNGLALNLYNIIDIFPDFDNKIKPFKPRIFENDSLIQNNLCLFIPVKKIDSVHIDLYSSTFAAIYK